MSRSATYRILAQGELSDNWSKRLGGLQITVERSEERGLVTVLIGRLRDQAALVGVLNTLHEIHMPVLSVECLGDD